MEPPQWPPQPQQVQPPQQWPPQWQMPPAPEPLPEPPSRRAKIAKALKTKTGKVALCVAVLTLLGVPAVYLGSKLSGDVRLSSVEDIVAKTDTEAKLLNVMYGYDLKQIDTYDYDVVIAGAGSGGVSAAVQAAREGSKVAIVEETDWIGGQMTSSAVSAMDDNPAERNIGLYGDFIARINGYYDARGKSTNTCKFRESSKCFEPSVGQKVLRQMLYEENVDVFLRTSISSVVKQDNKVTGLVTNAGATITSKVLIDATEYGDVIPLTGAKYRVGNSTSDNLNPMACIQDITYTAIIKKYPGGAPSNLRITTKPPGYDENRDVFAKMISNQGNNNYYFSEGRNSYPVTFNNHNKYRGLPDLSNPSNYSVKTDNDDGSQVTKTGLNWANDYPARSVYVDAGPNPTMPISYIENKTYRKATNCQAKLKTMQLIYYIQNELGYTDWSVANDEGYNTGYNVEDNDCPELAAYKELEKHFPVQPYVRESRRIVGVATVTAKDIVSKAGESVVAKSFDDALAIGSYFTDLHNCSTEETLESQYETSGDNSGGRIFQIPFGAFIPEKIDGFLVAEKNLSITRLVNGATRLQPTTMLTGQASGAIAAVAVEKGVQPRDVEYREVQKVLYENRSIMKLDLKAGIPSGGSASVVRTPASLSDSTPQAPPKPAAPAPAAPANQPTSDLEPGPIGNYQPSTLFKHKAKSDLMSRIEVSARLVEAFKLTSNDPYRNFNDVSISHPYYRHMQTIVNRKISVGCSAQPPNFCPDRALTRKEFAIFLARTIEINVDNLTAQDYPRQSFNDVPPTSNEYKYVEFIASMGITLGCRHQYYCGSEHITYGQIEAMIERAVNLEHI